MSKFEDMSNFHFDKEKYIRIVKAEGISTALTQLHHDVIQWEYESYEGVKGYNPDMWKSLDKVREFSRQLWELSLHSDKYH